MSCPNFIGTECCADGLEFYGELMDKQTHWERVYQTKTPTEVSWYEPHLETSLMLIESARIAKVGRIIDVGGGASTLIDDLLVRGYRNVTVLDISGEALELARQRLGAKAALEVVWLNGDITQTALPESFYDLWHDRAVFHFLITPKDRGFYIENLRRALKPGGHLIIATFVDDGPAHCSGLTVERYSAEKLQKGLGDDFRLLRSFRENHQTPSGATQRFLYAHFQKKGFFSELKM